MKEQINSPEKIQLSNKEIANLSGAQLKTLVIRMLTDMIEYGHKIEEEVKVIQNEIKQNIQGTKCERKETGTQINHLEQKEETRIQKKKMRRGLGTSRTTLNIPTSESEGCQKEKRKSKKLKTYFNK